MLTLRRSIELLCSIALVMGAVAPVAQAQGDAPPQAEEQPAEYVPADQPPPQQQQQQQPPAYDQAPPPPPAGYASQAPPPGGPMPVMPAASTTLTAEAQDIRYMDANADRVILFSTADTHPAGTFFFTNYELFLLQFGYAITDHVQLALTGLAPMIDEQPYFFDLSLKVNLVRSSAFRFALMGSLDYMWSGGSDGDGFFGTRLGAVGQVCFTPTCQMSVNLNLHAFINDSTTDFLPMVSSLGFLGHLSPLFSILLEPSYAFIVGDEVTGADGFLLSYGVRLSGANWGVDLTFIRPFVESFEDNPLIMGFPWVSFTYRTDGDPDPNGGAPPGGAPPAAGITPHAARF